MKNREAVRWAPPGLDLMVDRVDAGRMNINLIRVRDPGALIDSVDADSFGEDERFPYWSELWPSSVALARHIGKMGNLWGLDAVELGCGTGLAGVAAALAGAEVLFTDFEPQALALARANHQLNLGRPGRTMLFDWRTAPRGISADLVIAADVLYEKRMVAPFLDTLGRVLAPGGTALVAEPGRAIAKGVVESLERRGLKRSLHLEEVRIADNTHHVWIHAIHKGASPLSRSA